MQIFLKRRYSLGPIPTKQALYIPAVRIYTDLTRQLSFLTNNYKYEPGEDPDNKCILIPKYRAAGRVAPDGKRYPIRELKVDEKDLVPVRSIVTKFSKPDIVTPDCISTKFKDFTPGSAIGISFGTSLTEAIKSCGYRKSLIAGR